ncbi:uncharacterized protein zgc:152951 isoform X1 [Brienomyrus brachyistius]|uniref:uncharacterized protein zgc:152951 isoform X1 n=1 Tax=Brienomyrus brachyistius TaxID=42636 RepID=UPI0020B1BACC|nr:uncharacterized protein zgc:152951 isoform X1 [Brienomyrus brachyistius]XP_048828473.1 uncharacterized protein zgc:152951 isoform X1 [Brienomyrus brachyistius]
MDTAEGSPLGRVTLFSVEDSLCCKQARARLFDLGLPVQEVDLRQYSKLRCQLKELTGSHTVPQIFFNKVHVGGKDDLDKLSPNELERLMRLVWEEALSLDAPQLLDDCLNKEPEAHGEANQLSMMLQNVILRLYSDHLSADGQQVDYKAISRSAAFESYCELTVQLQHIQLHQLNHEEKLAFFINIYNALVIHGNLHKGSPKNIWQRYRFFNYVSYVIGGELFTLQDIENGVLRGNRRGTAQLWKPFSGSDPRLQVALPHPEPLVHFALNYGAKGCPPIKTYTAKDINNQLLSSAEAFLENDNSCMVDATKGEVKLSQIFKWYKMDFGDTDEELLNWILNHMRESPKKSSLQTVLAATKYKVSYMPYNWSTNSID